MIPQFKWTDDNFKQCRYVGPIQGIVNITNTHCHGLILDKKVPLGRCPKCGKVLRFDGGWYSCSKCNKFYELDKVTEICTCYNCGQELEDLDGTTLRCPECGNLHYRDDYGNISEY